MDVRDYLHVLRRGWLLILIVTLISVGTAFIYSLSTTPVFSAATKVFVSTQSAASVADLSQGNSFTQQVVQSYASIISTPIVLDPVISELGLDDTSASLAERVEASAASDTVVITISVSDESADRSAQIANAIGVSLSEVVVALSPTTSAGTPPVKVTTVQEATAPPMPASPNIPVNIALGLIVGLLVGFGLAVLRGLVDTRIRSTQDLASITDLPLLGGIFHDREAVTRPLIVQDDPGSIRAESFRALRTNLQFLDYGGRARSFVFTSAVPGEGKSTTISNLAIALTDNGMKVAIIDGDMRRPRLGNLFGLEGAVGLSDVLIGRAALDDVLQPWGNRSLSVLPAGQTPPNPSELLASPAMVDILATLVNDFDVVLIDTPPLLPVTDAAILTKLSGGAVLVAAAGRTHRNQVKGALDVLHGVNADVLGVVMTMLPTKGASAGSYGYGSYGYSPKPSPSAQDASPKVASGDTRVAQPH